LAQLLTIDYYFILLQLLLTRIQNPSAMEIDSTESDASDKHPFVVAPLIHEMGTNVTQLAEKRVGPVSPDFAALAQHLKRFSDFTQPNLGTECSLFPAVQEIMSNFVVPPEGQGQPVMGMGVQMPQVKSK